MKILLVECGVLGFGIRNPLTIRIQNPSSTDKEWNLLPGIRNPRCGIQNSVPHFLAWGEIQVVGETSGLAKPVIFLLLSLYCYEFRLFI